jgi:hypothetical protein
MNALENAKATAAQLNNKYSADGLTAFVFRTYRINKKNWQPTGTYGVRCYEAGEKVEPVFDGSFVMVPYAA